MLKVNYAHSISDKYLAEKSGIEVSRVFKLSFMNEIDVLNTEEDIGYKIMFMISSDTININYPPFHDRKYISRASNYI